MEWKCYQNKAAELFRSIGLAADTDVTIKGVRTDHNIDVLVKSNHVGFDITWIIECKCWNTKVSKLHVLALREIVHDTGADRGILLAENGFQSGALEAAMLTNVHLTTLADVADTASHDVHGMQLRDLYDRLIICKEQYWDLPKSTRIENGLRPDIGDVGYSGAKAIETAEDLLIKGLRGVYPIMPNELFTAVSEKMLEYLLPKQINTSYELVNIISALVQRLEDKIQASRAKLEGTGPKGAESPSA